MLSANRCVSTTGVPVKYLGQEPYRNLALLKVGQHPWQRPKLRLPHNRHLTVLKLTSPGKTVKSNDLNKEISNEEGGKYEGPAAL